MLRYSPVHSLNHLAQSQREKRICAIEIRSSETAWVMQHVFNTIPNQTHVGLSGVCWKINENVRFLSCLWRMMARKDFVTRAQREPRWEVEAVNRFLKTYNPGASGQVSFTGFNISWYSIARWRGEENGRDRECVQTRNLTWYRMTWPLLDRKCVLVCFIKLFGIDQKLDITLSYALTWIAHTQGREYR